MDGERFDRLTRTMATGLPRRSLLRAALAAGAVALLGRTTRGEAARQGDCSSYVGLSCQSDGECQGPPGNVVICPQMGCCGGVCADFTFDDANCSGCGNACPGGSTCTNGQCASLCQSPLVECAGLCVDISSDPGNCGGCFDACGAGAICADGRCLCEGALTNCDGACLDTTSDPDNCGDCGFICDGAICTNGQCGCANGLSACEGNCVDLESDPENCGACGVICGDETECLDATCQGICPPGTQTCDGVCVDITSDEANCGECGMRCPDGTECFDGQCPVVELSQWADVIRDVPGPDFCVTSPPTPDDLLRIESSPEATPQAGVVAAPVLTFAEADELMASAGGVSDERKNAALAPIRAALGCENAGDFLSGLGGMSDGAIRASLAERGWTPEVIGLLEDGVLVEPLPPDQRTGISGPASFGELPDGRLAVRFPLVSNEHPGQQPPNPSPEEPDDDGRMYIVTEISGRLMIDGITSIVPRGETVPSLSGSLAVQVAICPPGMTHEDFDAGACLPARTDDVAFAMFKKPGDDDLPIPYDVAQSYFGKEQSTSVVGLTSFEPPWDGYYWYVYGLQLGRTYWVEFRARSGPDPMGLIPGTTGLSLLSRRTFWGIPLTVKQPDPVVRAYVFQMR